ncbi:MAG: lecithin retinol acyltransferase family protein [Telmatospirillum sp.]|nr:lecithin retinol acyltransferase family protein [Telmatospirillum sp.]
MNDQTVTVELGDIVAVRRAAYWHVGIADGRGHAISRLPQQGVVRLPLETFARGRALHVVPIDRPSFPPAEIVARAQERLGEAGYDWLEKNCEHFVGECAFGEARSRQVRLAGAIGTLAGLALNFVGPNWIAAGAVGLVSAATFALVAKPPRAVAADDAALAHTESASLT